MPVSRGSLKPDFEQVAVLVNGLTIAIRISGFHWDGFAAKTTNAEHGGWNFCQILSWKIGIVSLE